ncbi:MAG: GNAT family N-acetyltransferase [Actinomyces sp.]|nr:MAG: GNAT family N-acetyltransferase [Actinomyces sp.]
MAVIGRVETTELPRILELNQGAVPAVSTLDAERLAWFAEVADAFLVARVGDEVAGFLIGLGPGVDYASENYRWFAARYDHFVYVDRVVVAPGHRDAGIGGRLYEAFAAHGVATASPVMLAEVNLRPPNEGSLRFHTRHGFVPVGEQDTEGGTKRVVLLERRLDRPQAESDAS